MLVNSWKSSLLIAALVCGEGAVFGQELHLKSRDVYTGPIPAVTHSNSESEARVRAAGTGPVHQIIQFDHVPGVADLNALLAAGFKIVGAVPDNAVMVIAPSAVTVKAAGVRWMGELEVGDKLSPGLGKSASGSERENQILAIVEFHADVEADVQQSIATAEGVTIERPAVLLPQHVIVSASMEKLRAIAVHDEVAYIFPADPALLAGALPGNYLMQCAGMLTLSGPISQYANVVSGWDLDTDHVARLGYVFGALTSKVPAATVESEILRAMNAWSAVTNVVFQVGSGPTAARTVFLEFVNGAHGDAYPFDSAGTALAHTFYPVPLNSESIAGDLHLNAAVNWHVGGDIDIYSVVLHELGHAIGLTHTDNPGDVMYPYYQRGMQLSANDIGAAQQLYGKPNGASASAAPITIAPLNSVSPLSLTVDPISPPGQAAQTAIAGTVSGGVPPIALQYLTDHGYSGKVTVGSSGTWSVAGVNLVAGTNTVTVTAFDSAQHTASQTVVVTRTATAPSAGAAPLSILITSPSSAVTTAKGATISAGGKSSGGTGITQVTWQTSTGASGTAVGTDQWLASNIPLLTGTNTIVVRAFDAQGASAWATAVIVRQ